MLSTAPLTIEATRINYLYKTPFRISYRTLTHAETLVVELSDGVHSGRGEAAGVSYHGETPDTMHRQLEDQAPTLLAALARNELDQCLPPGGLRNALDCALWDLRAKRAGKRAWELIGLETVRPLRTAFTLALDGPEIMAEAAARATNYDLLKIKLSGGDEDIARLTQIRRARPKAELIVDPNQAWNEAELHRFAPMMAQFGVTLIEQPLPVGQDGPLTGYRSPVPICADESCQSRTELASLVGKYDYINIKLDKTGGLTEALKTVEAARALGFKLMVGCMEGSSLAMAPAFIVGQACEVVDLDGPLLIASDALDPIAYQGNLMQPPEARLWG